MTELICNAIRTPDGTILKSHSVHDYQGYTDANGKYYAVDGGLDYLRRNGDNDYEELSLTLDNGFSKIRDTLRWGSRGKDGKQPFRRIKVKDLSTTHIMNILNLPYMAGRFKVVLEKELEFRESKDINYTKKEG